MGKRFKYYQPNSKDLKDDNGDCVIRALTKALNLDWLTVFKGLVPLAEKYWCMPNDKRCYTEYLETHGFQWIGISVKGGKKRPTVESFAKQHPKGTYVLRVAHHLVTCVDGCYYDTWDSGDKSVYGYFMRNL